MFFLIWLIMYTTPIWGSIIALIWFLKWIKKRGAKYGWNQVGKEMMITHMLFKD